LITPCHDNNNNKLYYVMNYEYQRYLGMCNTAITLHAGTVIMLHWNIININKNSKYATPLNKQHATYITFTCINMSVMNTAPLWICNVGQRELLEPASLQHYKYQ